MDSDLAQITYILGVQREKGWLRYTYDHPQIGVALRGEDRILVQLPHALLLCWEQQDHKAANLSQLRHFRLKRPSIVGG